MYTGILIDVKLGLKWVKKDNRELYPTNNPKQAIYNT